MTSGPGVWFDHAVVAIDELERGVSAFDAMTGVRPAVGGAHPTLGTENALVSLDQGRYLEILAPRPGGSLHAMVRDVGAHHTLTPFLWALATDDLARLRQRLSGAGFASEEPMAGSRVTASGDALHWSMCLMASGNPAGCPFFIEWAPDTRHPSTSAPAGCSLRSFTATSDDQVELQRLLDTVGYQTSVGAGSSGTMITLDTPQGVVTLGRSAPDHGHPA